MSSEAYEEGAQAFYDGKETESCPYHVLDPDYDKWQSGYLDADIYESGERIDEL